METLLQHLSLYIIKSFIAERHVVFSSSAKYIIGILKNDKIENLFINYKFTYNNYPTIQFNYKNDDCNFYVCKRNYKTIIYELADDFKDMHLIDILKSHYNKLEKKYLVNSIENIINIDEDLQYCELDNNSHTNYIPINNIINIKNIKNI